MGSKEEGSTYGWGGMFTSQSSQQPRGRGTLTIPHADRKQARVRREQGDTNYGASQPEVLIRGQQNGCPTRAGVPMQYCK